MKKFYLFMALFLGFAMASCTSEPDIVVEPSALEFTAAAGQQTITVSGVSGEISAVVSEDATSWCTATVNATRVIVDVKGNDQKDSRTATVTISYRNANRNVTVTQSGLDMNLDGILSEVNAPAAGGVVSLGTVVSDVKPEVNFDVDWISEPAVSESGEVTINVASTKETREAVVTVGIGETSKEVKVSQVFDMGLSLKAEILEQGILTSTVNIIAEALGSAADFAFGVFNPDMLMADDDEFFDALKSNYGSNNGVYNKEFYDEQLQLAGQFAFELDNGQTYILAGAAIDAEDNWSDELVRVEIKLDPNSPDAKYDLWIGEWNWEVTFQDGSKQVYPVTIQEDPNDNPVFYIEGFNGITMEEAGWQVFAVYDSADGKADMVFQTQQVGTWDNGYIFVLCPAVNIDSEGLNLYLNLGTEIARGVLSSDNTTASFTATEFDAVDENNNPFKETAEALVVFATLDNGQSWSMYAPSSIDDENPDYYSMNKLWFLPYGIEKTASGSAVASTSFRKVYDKGGVRVATDFYTTFNTASNKVVF